MITTPTYGSAVLDSSGKQAGQAVFNPNTGAPLSGAGQFNPNNGNKIGSSVLANTPVNSTQDASTIGNTQPATSPTTNSNTPSSGQASANSVIGTVGALNGNNGQNITGNQSALLKTTDTNTQNSQNTYNEDKSNTQSLINQYLGQGQDQLNQEKAAGVPELQTASNQLTQQYLGANATYNAQYNAILNRVGGTAETKAQEISALQQQHGYDLTDIGIRQSIAQNDYNNAESIIQHQIQIKYGALKDDITFQQNFLSQDASLLSQKQQQSFQANLQVQQQMYTQGTYYSQLNANSSMDILKTATANGAPQDTINNISKLIAQGASAGDVASAAGGYGANGSYTIAFNPATGNLEPFNSQTGKFKSGGTAPANTQTYDLSDPSASKIVPTSSGNYDLSTYATDPQYGLKINATSTQITNAVGNISSPQAMTAAIQSFAPNSNLDGTMVYNTATKAGIDPTLFAAQLKQESGFGTSNVAVANNNFGGVSYTGSASQMAAGVTQGTARPASEGGYYAKFPTAQAGLNAQANELARRKVPPPANTPGQTPTVQSKIQSVNKIKASLPSNIAGAVSYVNTTGDGYIDMSKITPLPSEGSAGGYPKGYSEGRAAQYAETYHLAQLNSDQVSAVQDFDGAMQKVHDSQDNWNSIAPKDVVEKGTDAFQDPFSVQFDTTRGQNLIKYKANVGAALSAFNSQTDSKALKPFSYALAEGAYPQVPGTSFLGYVGSLITTSPTLGHVNFASGDTLKDGNLKLDNIRQSLNSKYRSISNYFTDAPLSTDLPSTPVPKAGDIRQFGDMIIRYNADGSGTQIK